MNKNGVVGLIEHHSQNNIQNTFWRLDGRILIRNEGNAMMLDSIVLQKLHVALSVRLVDQGSTNQQSVMISEADNQAQRT